MTTNDHVNPYEIGKAGARNHGKRIPPITEASVNADKHYSVVPSTSVYGTVWPSSMMAAQDGLLQTLGPSFPQGFQGKISSAGWTKGAEGFEQQTFLGASITNFTINTGFGDSSSSLNVTLVNDEFNGSDGTWYGSGDDVYHRGAMTYQGEQMNLGDEFIPPAVGTPVFFKFGRNHATVSQAWFKTYYQKYGGRFIEDPKEKTYTVTGGPVDERLKNRYLVFEDSKNIQYANIKHSTGKTPVYSWENKHIEGLPVVEYFGDNRDYLAWDHFVFGGILSSVSNSVGSSNTFNVTVTDPREILSNTVLVLSDYHGTTFNNKNMYNIYGFLEYDFSKDFLDGIESSILQRRPLTRTPNGNFIGNDTYLMKDVITGLHPSTAQVPPLSCSDADIANGTCPEPPPQTTEEAILAAKLFGPEIYPMTGQGFSRKSERGIPVYRINQALATMFNYNGRMWQEHIDGGFGGPIDFRGFNYVVDFGGIPFEKIPPLYMVEQSQVDLLSYIQEICETINHDYFVSLLPVLNLPPTHYLWVYNQKMMKYGRFGDVITGIIRVDTIDKSATPEAGSVEKYINVLTDRYQNEGYRDGDNADGNSVAKDRKIQDRKYIESKNIGYDLSNITTDKFVVGAQEVNMYAFSRCKDGLYREYLKFASNEENNYERMRDVDMWEISTMLKQQVLPFYGFLGNKAVTIPIGFGPFQQIMLDSSAVEASNVGDYYITTEMELRAASISFNAWAQFLRYYDERYVELFNTYEKVESNAGKFAPKYKNTIIDNEKITNNFIKQRLEKGLEYVETKGIHSSDWNVLKVEDTDPETTDEYDYFEQVEACSVPRCAFSSASPAIGIDGLPVDVCSPPYGYPLYYKRAERLGVSGGAYVNLLQEVLEVKSSQTRRAKELKEKTDINGEKGPDAEFQFLVSASDRAGITLETIQSDDGEVAFKAIRSIIRELTKRRKEILKRYGFEGGVPPKFERDEDADEKVKRFREEMKPLKNIIDQLKLQRSFAEAGLDFENNQVTPTKVLNDLFSGKYKSYLSLKDRGALNGEATAAANKGMKINLKNAQKVYEWIKSVADKHLGKTYLVKIPRYTNVNYKHRSGPVGEVGGTYNWVDSGPFGFPPRYNDARKNTNNGSFPTSYFDPIGKNTKTSALNKERFHHFLLPDTLVDDRLKFREGALRSSWNEIDGFWEHNYKPEPQGGFFDWTMHSSGVSSRNKIIPDSPEFLSQGYRIKPYVRFDHSQFYDTTKIDGANNVTEQINTTARIESFIADLYNGFSSQTVVQAPGRQKDKKLEELKDNFTYVEVSVEEKLYMPPRTTLVKSHRYAEKCAWVPADLIWSDVKFKDPVTDEEKVKHSYSLPPILWRPGHEFFWHQNSGDAEMFLYNIWQYESEFNPEKEEIETTFYVDGNPNAEVKKAEILNKGYSGFGKSQIISVEIGPFGTDYFGTVGSPQFPYARLFDGQNGIPNLTENITQGQNWLKVTAKKTVPFNDKKIRDALGGVDIDFNEDAAPSGDTITGSKTAIGFPYCQINNSFFAAERIVNNQILLTQQGVLNPDGTFSYPDLQQFETVYNQKFPNNLVEDDDKAAFVADWVTKRHEVLDDLEAFLSASGSCGTLRNQIDYKNDPEFVEDFVRFDQKNPIDFDYDDDPMRIVSEEKYLDHQHVYAIVTLPGRVNAVVDGFMNDGLKSDDRVATYAKMRAADVTNKFDYDTSYTSVKVEIDEDGKEREVVDPLDRGREPGIIQNSAISGVSMSPRLKMMNLLGGEEAVERYLKNFNKFLNKRQNKVKLSSPETDAHFSSPSPVMPHLFVLPMMSHERCYGPWLSAGSGANFVGISDIGGKVEFTKDENLAPWTYGGYAEMNSVGLMKAQFSNSLQLYSEKGSFVLADAPTGISIAEPLIAGGPLITSISVNVSEGGIKTTVNMDSYSNNFGRLTKQKEDQISKLSRERQKNIDQLNDLRKKGILRNNANNIDLNPPFAYEKTTSEDGSMYYKEKGLEQGNTVYSNIIWSADERKKEVITDEGSVEIKDLTSFASIQHDGYIDQAQESIEGYIDLSLSRKKTAGDSLNSMFVGYDNSVHNPYMPTKQYNPIIAKSRRMRF